MRAALAVREGGANIAIVGAAESTGRAVFVNPPERIYLVKDDPAVLVDLTLEISHVRGIEVNRSFRVLEPELGEAIDPDHLQLRVTPVDSGLNVERFIFAEAPQDDLLQGRDVLVLRVDSEALVARTDDELTHEFSPSVGTPKGAVCDNPNPTEGETISDAAAPSPAAAASDQKTT